MTRRHCHRHATQEPRRAQQRLHGIWPQAKRLRTANEEYGRADSAPGCGVGRSISAKGTITAMAAAKPSIVICQPTQISVC